MIRVQKSYGNRVKGAVVGVIFGVFLFFGSFFLIAWNERDAVRQTAAITEIEKVAIADVPAERVEPDNEGQLVHIRNSANTDEILANVEFAIRENAIRLRWDASIYQWDEDRREEDDETIYEYEKKWVDHVIDSSQFQDTSHSNAGSEMHFHDGRKQAQEVQLGAFVLSERLIDQIGNEKKYNLSDDNVVNVQPAGTVRDGVFFTGDPDDPQIGDEKVEVSIVDPRQDVTVMATQQSNTFAAYQTKVGIPKELLYMGLLTKEEVIAKQRFAAALRRWLIRGGGFLAMWIGLMLLFRPLRAILSFVPLLSRIVGGAIGLVTFVLALVLSLITIAVFWFVARPLLSIILLIIAAVGLFLLLRKRDSAPTPPPLPQ